jgi:4-hydroxythreonine-4-phosphate dehydrogenase
VAARSFLDAHPGASILVIGHEGVSLAGLPFHAVDRFDGTEASAGRVSARALEAATRMAEAGDAAAVVTGPVSKPALRSAGWDVPGQTEMLQRLTGAPVVGMLMAAERTRLGGALRVLLATTHLPLRAVPERVTVELLETQTRLLIGALRHGWGIADPRVAVCALNPHASDGGLFGDEEARILGPAVARLRGDGLLVQGPFPADTVFRRAVEGEFDAVVAPYHDVGMAAFKTVSFGSGVNVSLGLPFVRTSPDHGTAFDIAGRGVADPSSTLAALSLAHRLAHATGPELGSFGAPWHTLRP